VHGATRDLGGFSYDDIAMGYVVSTDFVDDYSGSHSGSYGANLRAVLLKASVDDFMQTHSSEQT